MCYLRLVISRYPVHSSVTTVQGAAQAYWIHILYVRNRADLQPGDVACIAWVRLEGLHLVYVRQGSCTPSPAVQRVPLDPPVRWGGTADAGTGVRVFVQFMHANPRNVILD